jgi:predicted MFS family arabinose efflux permease
MVYLAVYARHYLLMGCDTRLVGEDAMPDEASPGELPAERPPAPPRPRLTRSEWGLLLILAAVYFTLIVDFVVIMPLGERLMRDLGLPPIGFAALVSVYGFAASAADLVGAAYLDRYCRKKALLFLFGGFAASVVLSGLATDVWTLLAARVSAGAFGGMTAVALLAVVGDCFPEARRGTAFGVVLSSSAVAQVAGIPTGLLIASWWGRSAPFFAVGGLCLLIWLVALARLPAVTGHLSAARRSPWAEFRSVAAEPAHRRAFLFSGVMVLGTFTIGLFMAPYLMANGGLSETDLSWVYFWGGLCSLIGMNLVGPLTDRLGHRLVFRVLASLAIAATLLVTNLPPVGLVAATAAVTFFMVAANGRMVPAQALLVSCAVPEKRGSFLSMNTAVQHAMCGLAPLIAGALVGRAADGRLTGYPVVGLVAAGCALLALVLAGWLRPAAAPAPEPAAEEPVAEAEPVAVSS